MKLRMVFDVMFRGDSLTIAITDTSNRLMVSSSFFFVFILCQGVYNIYSSALRIWGDFMPFSLL